MVSSRQMHSVNYVNERPGCVGFSNFAVCFLLSPSWIVESGYTNRCAQTEGLYLGRDWIWLPRHNFAKNERNLRLSAIPVELLKILVGLGVWRL